MSKFGMKMRNSWRSLAAACAALSVVAIVPSASHAQQLQCADDSGPSKTLSIPVARSLQTIYEQIQAEQRQEALAALNQLFSQRGSSMSDFDRATALELRGSVYVQLENYSAGLRDFEAALNTNALPVSRNNQLRFFIAQLNFQLERYSIAVNGLNQWINFANRCGQTVDPNAYYLLAAGYIQMTPSNFTAAMGPAENAVRGNEAAVRDPAQSIDPQKSYYDLLNLVYSERRENTKRLALLEKMINIWPSERSYWTQLAGLYSQTNRDREAFAIMEVAYRAGLLETEDELQTLIQYYSFFDNPFRGAKMLEREMEAGNIKRTQANLVQLSQLWSQSREHKRAIPILREASRRSGDGELSYRLGMVLVADEKFAEAETALEAALNKGGMTRRQTGEAWMLLGTARFSQAGPEDTEIWADARDAFEKARDYELQRRQASDWITYIDAVASTYKRQIELEEQQRAERCRNDLGRVVRDQRILQLRSQPATPEQQAKWDEIFERCAEFRTDQG